MTNITQGVGRGMARLWAGACLTSLCLTAWASPPPASRPTPDTAACRAFFYPIYQQARRDGTVDRSALTTREAIDEVLHGYCQHAQAQPGPQVFQRTDFFWALTMAELTQHVEQLTAPPAIPHAVLENILTPAATRKPGERVDHRHWARVFLSHPALTVEQRVWIEQQFPGVVAQVAQARQNERWLARAQRDTTYLHNAMKTAPNWVLHMYQTQQLNLLPQDIAAFPYQPDGSPLAGSNVAIAVLKNDGPRLAAMLVRAAESGDVAQVRQVLAVSTAIPNERVHRALMAMNDPMIREHALIHGQEWVSPVMVTPWLTQDRHREIRSVDLSQHKIDPLAVSGYATRGVSRLWREPGWASQDEGRDFLENLERMMALGLTLPTALYERAFTEGPPRLRRVFQGARNLPPPLVQRYVERLKAARDPGERAEVHVSTLAANTHIRWTDEQLDACLDFWVDSQVDGCLSRREFQLTRHRLVALLRALDRDNPRNPDLYTKWETLVPSTWYVLGRRVGTSAIHQAIDALMASDDLPSLKLLARNPLIPLGDARRARLAKRLAVLEGTTR